MGGAISSGRGVRTRGVAFSLSRLASTDWRGLGVRVSFHFERAPGVGAQEDPRDPKPEELGFVLCRPAPGMWGLAAHLARKLCSADQTRAVLFSIWPPTIRKKPIYRPQDDLIDHKPHERRTRNQEA
jgi:hypothetical protein